MRITLQLFYGLVSAAGCASAPATNPPAPMATDSAPLAAASTSHGRAPDAGRGPSQLPSVCTKEADPSSVTRASDAVTNAKVERGCAALRRQFDDLVAARSGAQRDKEYVVYSTHGFGCDATPFALEPEARLGELMLAPMFASGVERPEEVIRQPGRYRLTGHYTGRLVDVAHWYQQYYGRPGGEGVCRTRVPEFIVSAWCFDGIPRAPGAAKFVCIKE